MILPGTWDERCRTYRNVYRECIASAETRRARNAQRKTWALSGTESGERARENKLMEFILYASSYLFSADSIKFGVVLPPKYGAQWIPECDAAKEELHRLWHDSDAGAMFDLMVTWANIYDTVVGKVIVSDGEPCLEVIPDPGDISVRNEGSDKWDKQEAIVHEYYLEMDRFRRMVAPLPNRDALMALAEAHAMPGYAASNGTLAPAIERTIILSAASPSMVGAVNGMGSDVNVSPQVNAPVVRMAELWIMDDNIGDYRVVPIMRDALECLWDARNPLVPQEHPFHPLSLQPVLGYIWGEAPIDYLLGMQQWYTSKMAKLDDRDDKLVDPPVFAKGFSNIPDEVADRFRSAGGFLASQNPTAEITPMPPAPVAEPYELPDRINAGMQRAGGLPKGMTGQTEPGVRSGEQAEAQASLAAGPTVKKAMAVENCAGGIATQMLRLLRRIKSDTLIKIEGNTPHEFLLSQMPGDVVARVWGNSSSPILAKSLLMRAKLAHDAKAIDNEDFLEYLALPMTDTKLKAKARVMAQQAAERQGELLEAKKKEIESKVRKNEAQAAKV